MEQEAPLILKKYRHFLPDRFEPGTPNIPGILGLHAALCDLEKQSMEEIRQHELMLTQYFIDGILNLDPERKISAYYR